MSQPSISRLNYDAVLSTEDYTAHQQVIENEIITRFKLGSGFPNQNAQFGIVDAANPHNLTASETSRPLFVQVSSQNALAVAVNSGYSISPNGAIIFIPTFQELISLSTTPQSGKIYVVVAESILNTADGITQLNDYQVNQSSQQTLSSGVSSVEYVAGWQPADNQVALAVVKVVDVTGGGQALQIDLTQNTYPFNRPWFSLIDTQHRAFLGSGTVTDKNPHATSINDLTVPGTVSLFSGLTGQGVVISEARLRNKMIGALICNDSITFANIKTDSSGTITKGSPYNKVGAQYAELTKFPLRLGSVYDSTSPAVSISAEVIPNTNLLVFGPNESFQDGQTVIAQYTSSSALRPPTVLTSNFLQFSVPDTGEVVVAGGFTYPTIADPTLSFEGTGPIARRYAVYLMPSGVLTSFPEILVPSQSALSSISGTFTPIAPARISVGITNTTGSLSLDVEVTVTGTVVSETDATPGNVTEILSFTPGSGYLDQIVPSSNYDLPGQVLVTSNRFSSVTSISATVVNAGPNPQIQVWAEVEPGMSPDLNDACPIATVFWNGNAVNKIEDRRPIQRGWVAERQHLFSSGEVELDSIRLLNAIKPSVTSLTNTSFRLFTEDFEDLKFFDSAWGFISPTTASGVIGLNSSITLLPGDTIQLTPSKTLTAVTGTPAVPGQFDVGSPISPIAISQIVTNIITAVNDPLFSSNVVASQDPSNPINIKLVLQSPIGIAANSVVISATTTNPGAASTLGFNFGADGFGECYLDRYVVGIASPVIPDGSNLNPYQYAYRRRYRSRAYSLLPSIGAQTTFYVEVHGQNKSFDDSVRIRGSKFVNPQVFEGWQVMTPVAAGIKGLYQVTFSSPMHKVQVEFYGKARGLSVYMARP